MKNRISCLLIGVSRLYQTILGIEENIQLKCYTTLKQPYLQTNRRPYLLCTTKCAPIGLPEKSGMCRPKQRPMPDFSSKAVGQHFVVHNKYGRRLVCRYGYLRVKYANNFTHFMITTWPCKIRPLQHFAHYTYRFDDLIFYINTPIF